MCFSIQKSIFKTIMSGVALIIVICIALGTLSFAHANASVVGSQATATVSDDCYISSWNVNEVQCTQDHLYIGFNDFYSKGQTLSLIKFNLPSIPSNRHYIASATLMIHQYAWQGESNYSIDIHRLADPWSEATQPTWNSAPRHYTTLGGSITMAKTAGWRDVDITDLVQEWYDGDNYGLLLEGRDPNAYGGAIASSEWVRASPSSGSPYIDISFAQLPIDTPTNTPVTPTNTPVTPTNTPVTPTDTPTSTPTNTPIPIPDSPSISPIFNDDYDGDYTVSWMTIASANSYILEEQKDGGAWNQVYSGSNFTHNATGQTAGTWCYRVQAIGTGGTSATSTVSCTQVSIIPDSPTIADIASPDALGGYTVSWSSVASADGYDLQEQHNNDGTWLTVYTDTASQYVVSEKGEGSWCYRVTSSNVAGYSPPSNIECVEIVQGGDEYELDNSCEQATFISLNGEFQSHTFHTRTDEDWVRIDAVAGEVYTIIGSVPAGSTADLEYYVYDACGGPLTLADDNPYSVEMRRDIPVSVTGKLYIRIINRDDTNFGDDTTYRVRVSEKKETGLAIIVAGRLEMNDHAQRHIQQVGEDAYQMFLQKGYSAEHIHYMSAEDDDYAEHETTYDNLRGAITQWASDWYDPVYGADIAPTLMLYMVSHGTDDVFYLDEPNGERVDPQTLDNWLTQLEQDVPGIEITVIIEACNSGSFIEGEQSVSRDGRLIITSARTEDDAYLYQGIRGALFSTTFIDNLLLNSDMYTAFEKASQRAEKREQIPQMDANGDKQFNQLDWQLASQRDLNTDSSIRLADGDEWVPEIIVSDPIMNTSDGESAVISVEVRDDTGIESVWAIVYPPSYDSSPVGALTEGTGLQITLTVAAGQGAVTPQTGVQYTAEIPNLAEAGEYIVEVHADDGEFLSDIQFLTFSNSNPTVPLHVMLTNNAVGLLPRFYMLGIISPVLLVGMTVILLHVSKKRIGRLLNR